MNTVVYYPHIHPTPEWLRFAALCWDKVYRLVPSNSSHDSETIRGLDASLGGILDTIDVREMAENPIVREKFISWLDSRSKQIKARPWNLLKHEDELTPMFKGKWSFSDGSLGKLMLDRGLAKIESIPIEVQVPSWEKESYLASRYMETVCIKPTPMPGSAHEKYEQLRNEAFEKYPGNSSRYQALMDEAEKIKQQNLVIVKDNSETIHMPKDIALQYLSLCASVAAEEGQRDLFTGGEQFTDIVFHKFAAVRGEMVTSVLKAYLPEDIYTLDPKRIAEFREKFSVQRLKYQNAIQSLTQEFGQVASEGQLEILKDRMIELAKQRVEETIKTFRNAKVNTALKAIGIASVPLALFPSLFSALGTGIFTAASISSSVSLFTAASLEGWSKAKIERNQNPWSYVVEANKFFKH